MKVIQTIERSRSGHYGCVSGVKFIVYYTMATVLNACIFHALNLIHVKCWFAM